MGHLPLTTIVVPVRCECFVGRVDKKTYLDRVLSTVIDIWKVLFYPTDPLVEISFVVTKEIGQMNFEPAESTFT